VERAQRRDLGGALVGVMEAVYVAVSPSGFFVPIVRFITAAPCVS